MMNAFTVISTRINTIMGDGPVARVYAFMSLGFPFGAAFQFWGSMYVFKWSMPALWSVARAVGKWFAL